MQCRTYCDESFIYMNKQTLLIHIIGWILIKLLIHIFFFDEISSSTKVSFVTTKGVAGSIEKMLFVLEKICSLCQKVHNGNKLFSIIGPDWHNTVRIIEKL